MELLELKLVPIWNASTVRSRLTGNTMALDPMIHFFNANLFPQDCNIREHHELTCIFCFLMYFLICDFIYKNSWLNAAYPVSLGVYIKHAPTYMTTSQLSTQHLSNISPHQMLQPPLPYPFHCFTVRQGLQPSKGKFQVFSKTKCYIYLFSMAFVVFLPISFL